MGSVVAPPIPVELCGDRGCTYLAGHVERGHLAHTWEFTLSEELTFDY